MGCCTGSPGLSDSGGLSAHRLMWPHVEEIKAGAGVSLSIQLWEPLGSISKRRDICHNPKPRVPSLQPLLALRPSYEKFQLLQQAGNQASPAQLEVLWGWGGGQDSPSTCLVLGRHWAVSGTTVTGKCSWQFSSDQPIFLFKNVGGGLNSRQP